MPSGIHYKIKTYPSGRRVRQRILGDRVIATEPMARIRQTKTRRKLKKRRRRIGMR